MSEQENILVTHGKDMQRIGIKFALEMAKIDPENIVSILEEKLKRLEQEDEN